ncbi:uncharacterized protein BP01DRAFT_118633 [Aspergillus saccharolyticus JOP 1030-1]|uniref:Uncharacterized protein n=1 Tax=Aspergillus saccharolyticus JOP 1030-1 TaxID=1450539 RepID=A0A318ZQU3_9EURO|nr:hypothetical protein BP01DRAFT_118633 [Aspergillus saccharolyticus JOP 1030-1]PYH49015.1 hypothetical protein BP01DRAFT_118633 [Aspergillus saccharolyticus JOP 1030-1]
MWGIAVPYDDIRMIRLIGSVSLHRRVSWTFWLVNLAWNGSSFFSGRSGARRWLLSVPTTNQSVPFASRSWERRCFWFFGASSVSSVSTSWDRFTSKGLQSRLLAN